MDLGVSEIGELRVVAVQAPRIDAVNAIQFKDGLREAARGGSDRVVLDLSGVGFVDSSGLGAVVAAMKLLAPEQKLELSGLTEPVEKVFRMTRMDSVFTIHPGLDALGDGTVNAH